MTTPLQLLNCLEIKKQAAFSLRVLQKIINGERFYLTPWLIRGQAAQVRGCHPNVCMTKECFKVKDVFGCSQKIDRKRMAKLVEME
jgi:hypothetical protein